MMTTRAIDCTNESVALSQPKSSNIGLKNMPMATALCRKMKDQDAATMYQPKKTLGFFTMNSMIAQLNTSGK